MTIQHLRILGYLAECGSISKAAEYCFMSQSAMTRHIRAMEEELGYALFTRHSNGVRLTSAGQAFYQATRKVIADYNAAVLQGRSACSAPVKTTLRIGVYNYSLSFVSALCSYCETLLPHITFDFISCRISDAEKHLDDNLLDICFPAEYNPNAAGIAHENLLQTKNCLLIPKGHPLCGSQTLSLHQLHGQTLLLLPAGAAVNADRMRTIISQSHPEIRIVDYSSPIQADALALSKQYILMTLGFFEPKPEFSAAVLTDSPDVPLGLQYRENDRDLIQPVIEAVKAYIAENSRLGPFFSKL